MPILGRTVFLLLFLSFFPVAVGAGDSPWFVRGKVGQAQVDASFGEPALGRTVDDEDVAAAVELGRSFGRHLAVQAGYHDFGEYEALEFPCEPGRICPEVLVPFELATMEITGVSLVLVPRLPIGERFALVGKVGALEWEAELVSDTSGRTLETFDDREVLIGIGFAWDFPGGLGLQLELEGFSLDVTAATAGIGWRF